MKIIIDADACPVVRQAVQIAKENKIESIVVCDTAHIMSLDYGTIVTVDQGADSADYKVTNLANPNDIVITQDYGLAAMCLAKNSIVLNQNGQIYTAYNIDGLLQSRHYTRQYRMKGGHTKGTKKRTKLQDEQFVRALRNIILENKKDSNC